MLHTVYHAGHRSKVLRLVIVPGVFTQSLEQDNASGGEKAVGAYDNQYNGKEKQRDCGKRRLCKNGNCISSAQCQNSYDCKEYL